MAIPSSTDHPPAATPTAVRSVGLNALYLDPDATGGVETYLRELVPAMAQEFPNVRFVVATTRAGAAALREEGWSDFAQIRSFGMDAANRPARVAAEHTLLPIVAARERWDILHGLGNRASVATPCPSVLTLHDVIFYRTPTLSLLPRLLERRLTERAVRAASAIITLTESARAEIVETFAVDHGRVAVVPHGVGQRVAAAADPAEIRARYGLGDGQVVLCVAAKRPHKNQELLVRAAALLPDDACVVCVGQDAGHEAALRELVAALGVGDRVRLLGYVGGADLEGLWGVAACAALPTLAEGFGLPVVEAMARGVPVACSDIPVLHEVGGSAVRYFDPHDPDDAAQAIRSALGNAELAERGRVWAGRFSWRAAARATFEVYERVAR